MDAPRGFALADGGQVPAQRLSVPLAAAFPPPPTDPSKVPPKTPISLLQEACLRRKLSPVYELISTEGQVHEPVFTYRCSVDGVTGQGSGKSKKTAKHLAALGVLEDVVRRGKGPDWAIPGPSVAQSIAYLATLMPDKTDKRRSGPADEEDEGKDGNPVGKLQERCTQLKLPAPEYQLEEEGGLPHERSFKVLVSLGKLKAHSQAKTKKAAKRIAAELMLSQIANVSSSQGFDEDDLVEEEKEPGAAYPAELEAQLSGLRTGPSVIEEEDEASDGPSDPRSPRPVTGRRRGLEELLAADLSLERPSASTLAWLREVARSAEDPSDPVSFRKLDNPSVSGQVQCLVQLSTVPVAVVGGTGATEADAQHDAALHALHYLKIMAQRAAQEAH